MLQFLRGIKEASRKNSRFVVNARACENRCRKTALLLSSKCVFPTNRQDPNHAEGHLFCTFLRRSVRNALGLGNLLKMLIIENSPFGFDSR